MKRKAKSQKKLLKESMRIKCGRGAGDLEKSKNAKEAGSCGWNMCLKRVEKFCFI
jgi:hypothetical protein